MGETLTQPAPPPDYSQELQEEAAGIAARRDAVPPEFRTQPPPPRAPRTGTEALIEGLPASMQPIAQEQLRMLRQTGGGGSQVATARRDLELARGEREAREQYSQQYGERLRRYEGERIRTPDFLPTQENAMSLGTLFGLIATAGTLMGTKGNQSAMGALQAMNGMMAGWRQGRADLYNRERQNFETEMRRVQAQNEELRRGFQDDLKLMQTNMDAGMARARERAAQAGISIAAAGAARQGAQAYISWLNGLQSTMAQIERQRQAASGSAPIVVPRQAADGTTSYFYAHRDGSPIMGQDGQPLPAPPPRAAGAGTGARRGDAYGFGAIVSTAANEAAASIENLVGLSRDSTTGIFQGRNTTGLLNSPLGVMANVVTSEDTQRYNVELANFGKFLAQVQRGGRVVPVADMEASQRAFAIKEGDSYGTVLTKLAAMRQQLERALEVRIADPNTPDELKPIFRRNAEDIARAIPFSVGDVNRYLQSRDGFQTFSDMIRQSGISSSELTPNMALELYRGPAMQAFGAYEPERYEYQINPETGNIRRRARGGQ